MSTPEVNFRSNVDGTYVVLRRLGREVTHLVYACSSSCYGILDVYPTPETAAIRPEYPYALTNIWVSRSFRMGGLIGLRQCACGSSTSIARAAVRAVRTAQVYGVFLPSCSPFLRPPSDPGGGDDFDPAGQVLHQGRAALSSDR